jgi:hypothetical protein
VFVSGLSVVEIMQGGWAEEWWDEIEGCGGLKVEDWRLEVGGWILEVGVEGRLKVEKDDVENLKGWGKCNWIEVRREGGKIVE